MASSQPMPSRWASVAEAAVYAGCSERTIRRWISQERLPANRYRVGRHRIEIDLNELDKLRRPIGDAEEDDQEARTA